MSVRTLEAGGPIAWHSLHMAVTARLRDLIVEGRLPEGSRIVERELCEQLAVSRTPLREAFKVLAAEGLIEILPNRGAVVARLGPREARDMLRVIGRLEALAGELACAQATDDEIRKVRALHERMMRCYRRGKRMDYFHLNQEIHLAIVGLAQNDTLTSLHRRLHARMKRIRFRGNDAAPNWAHAVADHEAIIAALERRDGKAIAAALQCHLDASWLRLADSLRIDPDTFVPVALEREAGAPTGQMVSMRQRRAGGKL